jgi:hypothetical protein
MSEWEVVRHQVAVAGRVSDAQTGRSLGGVQVKITNAPAAFLDPMVILARSYPVYSESLAAARATLDNDGASVAEKLAAAQAILDYWQAQGKLKTKRRDLTQSAVDGIFYFLNLPDGDYTLTAAFPGLGTRYGTAGATATVTSNADNIDLVTTEIALPPTTVKGQISGPSLDDDGSGPVVLAAVRVRRSGEQTHTDDAGHYLLTGLEIGQRTLFVSARGYQTAEQTVTLNQAGAEQTLNFTLALPTT